MAQWITFLVFGGGGLALLYVGVTQYVLQRRLLKYAIPIEVEIIKSEIVSSASASSDRRPLRSTSTVSHKPDVRFRYYYNGSGYESDLLRPNIIVRGYASHEAAAQELELYAVGAQLKSFVDPSQPDKAFLKMERGAGPLVFIAVRAILPPLAWFVGSHI